MQHGTTSSCAEQVQEKKSRTKQTLMARRTEDGDLENLTPKESTWWLYYVANPLLLEDRYHQDKFRSRFRLPYQNYLELVDDDIQHLGQRAARPTRLNYWC